MFSKDSSWDTFTDDTASLRSILLAKKRIGSRRCLMSRHEHRHSSQAMGQHSAISACNKLHTTQAGILLTCSCNSLKVVSYQDAHTVGSPGLCCTLPKCSQTSWQALEFSTPSPPTLYPHLKLEIGIVGEAKELPTNTAHLCLVRTGSIKRMEKIICAHSSCHNNGWEG